ncbi:MAG: hypothetical protein ACLPX5_12050 [Dissulfurispiraceae bacterium]
MQDFLIIIGVLAACGTIKYLVNVYNNTNNVKTKQTLLCLAVVIGIPTALFMLPVIILFVFFCFVLGILCGVRDWFFEPITRRR